MQALDESVSEEVEGQADKKEQRELRKKSEKKSKKVLDKSEWLWYNHQALLRERESGPWKLNNDDKERTLEINLSL